jgi:hypothetical protein
MNIPFPYMARWKPINWTRYHSPLIYVAEKGHHLYMLQPLSLASEKTK